MGSSEEMFERGVRDAEQDELNPFYYQHYYHYRRGYDKARRSLRHTATADRGGGQRLGLPALGVGLLVLLAVGVLAYGLWGRSSAGITRSAGVRADTTPVASSVVIPTRIPRVPTGTPAPPTPPPPALQLQGAAVVVNLSGNPLRMRAGAGVKQKVVGRLPEGSEVKLVEGPVEADGYNWWRVESGGGSGWVAERSPEGVAWLQPK